MPQLFCQPTTSGCGGKAGGLGNLTQAERNTICGHAGEDIDCPTGGCVGFSLTLPGSFMAQDQTTAIDSALLKKPNIAMCFPKDANWNVTPTPSDRAGKCVGKKAPIKMDFCTSPAPPTARFPAPQRR